jgi:hypothetical protein
MKQSLLDELSVKHDPINETTLRKMLEEMREEMRMMMKLHCEKY